MEHLTALSLKLPPGIEKAAIELLTYASYACMAWTAAGVALAIKWLKG